MADGDDNKKTLSLGSKGTLSLKAGSIPSGGSRSGAVVQVKRKRTVTAGKLAESESVDVSGLTKEERDVRLKALQQAQVDDEKQKEIDALRAQEEADKLVAAKKEERTGRKKLSASELREKELAELKKIEQEERKNVVVNNQNNLVDTDVRRQKDDSSKPKRSFSTPIPVTPKADEDESYRSKLKRNAAKPSRASDDARRGGKLTVTQVMNKDYDRDRGPSLAALRRAKMKAKMQAGTLEAPKKVHREVTLPEFITVQELANRMTEKGGDIIKSLMGMGVMATINQSIDADTAQLIVEEFGHTCKRVTEADVEIGLEGIDDTDEELYSRPPVVTIMGHVDHGKTSLLDALRQTDVVAGEAGGITQHIGAYQITMESGQKITFLDTPGHAAFTEMRARGANVTDIVILVVAANDSIMPQTIEAIAHAKAADVPLIVAINKVDLPDAEPYKVKQDLLQYEVVIEELGGDVQCIEVSAKKKMGLDTLEEAILLQAEVLELKANPLREAQGTVVEAKQEQGRGNVATVLIEKGTLRVSDIFVVGSQWGKVRAIINDRGRRIKEAIPGLPVEVLGLNGAPEAGDSLSVVDSEARAREVAEYRSRVKRDALSAARAGGSSLEALLAQAKIGEKKKLPVVIKADVHGSVEAIIGSLEKITEGSDELAIQVLHSGVGGITESDVILANASGALIVGFNVRANSQARDMVQRDNVDMRYYNIIYNVIDDAKAILSGMLAPTIREDYIGQAEIREVFNITKVGKVAGCMVKNGEVRRGNKVRLLRDDVVIHEGTLKTLKRFKDEVKDVREGMECGMAFESYDDIKAGDVIECFEVVEEARSID